MKEHRTDTYAQIKDLKEGRLKGQYVKGALRLRRTRPSLEEARGIVGAAQELGLL